MTDNRVNEPTAEQIVRETLLRCQLDTLGDKVADVVKNLRAHGLLSEGAPSEALIAEARDAHAEHVQEAGEYGLPGGFEVVESLHGRGCDGCRQEARSAAIHARAMGSVGATHSTMKAHDPWEDPEVAHSARVERPKNQE